MTDLNSQILGKYQLITRLGRGGMADVYQAHQSTLDRYVALKVLDTRLAEESDFVERFRREAAMVARLRHPNIVQVHDFDVEGELYFMVMELVGGPTLKSELTERHHKSQPFTLVETAQIFTALSNAIDYAHARSMIHHDLKPGNVMFTAEGEVVLTDFGLARIVGTAHNTETGSVYGTPAYMSPEQAQGERGDGRSDIYALGVILYEIVTGQLPFEADTPFALIMKHLNEPPPPPTAIKPDLPQAVEAVILKALSKEPDARYQRAGEMARALREAGGLTIEDTLAMTITTLGPAAQIEEGVATPTPEWSTPTTPPESPYRGLYAFKEEDALFFFGREAFTEQLVAAIHKQSMVAVIGPSGSGKSSVVYAGLIAQLRKDEGGRMKDEESNSSFTIHHSPFTIASFRPGSRPFQALAAALIPRLEPELSETDRLVETRKLAEAMSQGELPLYEVMDRILGKGPENGRILLVADQFEELYTLCPDVEIRHRFLDMLLEVVDIQQFRSNPAFTFVLTLRVDFLGQALTHRPFADALQDADVKLGPMTRQELGWAIANPARRQRAMFESGLVARILDDVGDEPGNLPLLEFALTALWERMDRGRLSHEAYEAIGRVEGALARYAEEVYERLNQTEQEEVRRVFIQMVRPGQGTEDTRRLATRAELGETDWQLVQRLADARLVVTGQDTAGQETVEVVHEALIRGWGRLREWMTTDRAFRVWQERLRAALNQWQTSGQDEGALLRGVPLAEAEGWLAQREADLSQAERDFVEASLAARRQQEAAERLQQDRERALEQSALRRLRVIVAVLVVASIVGITLSIIIFNQSQTNRQVAEQAQAASTAAIASQATAEVGQQAALEAQATAIAERDRTQLALSRQLAALGLANLDGQLDLALLLNVEAIRTADTFEARSGLLAGLQTSPHLSRFLRGHTDRVQSAAFTPDGQILASGSDDGTVILWDVASGQPLGPPLTGHTGRVLSVVFSPDGQTLASGSRDNTIILWDVPALLDTGVSGGQPLAPPLTGHTSWVTSLVFSPDGQTLASGSRDNTIILWDVASRQPLGPPLAGHTEQINSVIFSPDGQDLASASDDGTIILWDVREPRSNDVTTGQPLGSPLTGHADAVNSVAFSSDGQTLASGNDDGTIILWDVANGQALGSPLTNHTAGVSSLAFSLAQNIQPSMPAEVLASGSDDGTIILWDIATGQPLGPPLTGHTGAVNGVTFSSNGQMLASSSDDGTIILWNVNPHQRLTGHTDAVWSVTFSSDGHTLASGSDDGTIILWDTDSGQALGPPLTGHTGSVTSVAFSPDGQILASAGRDLKVRLWSVGTRQLVGVPLTGHPDTVWSVAFSPDGQILASGSEDETIIMWDVASGQPLGQLRHENTFGVNEVAFSPDGQMLASAEDSELVRLWDVASGQPLAPPLTGHTGDVMSVAFSPDGQTLASSSSDNTVILWDVAVGQSLAPPLTGHPGNVTSVAFSPDGRILASGGFDGTIRVWDVVSRRLLGFPLTGHTRGVNSVAFSPDGHKLASGSEDNTIILWDIGFESWQAQACHRANRNLTQEEWRQFFGEQPYRATCPDLPVPEPGAGN